MTLHRAQLRRFFRDKRRNLSDAERSFAQGAISEHLWSYAPIQEAQTIAAFLATDGEVDLTSWISRAWNEGKTLALPTIGEQTMAFHVYEPTTELTPNRFGIPEPATAPLIDRFDCVLAPLVACDATGARLGMGGGFYDRYFADGTAQLIGVAFACQKSDEPLVAETWDVRLDAIVTELGVEEFA